jgi:hypothetical protein
VQTAWRTAWANETVRDHFADSDAVHFHVEAVGDELQVYVAADETAPPRVQADVDLADETVTGTEAPNNVVTAGNVETTKLAPIDASAFDDGEPVTLVAASDADVVTVERAELSTDAAVTIDSVGSTDGEYTVEVTTPDAGGPEADE